MMRMHMSEKMYTIEYKDARNKFENLVYILTFDCDDRASDYSDYIVIPGRNCVKTAKYRTFINYWISANRKKKIASDVIIGLLFMFCEQRF